MGGNVGRKFEVGVMGGLRSIFYNYVKVRGFLLNLPLN